MAESNGAAQGGGSLTGSKNAATPRARAPRPSVTHDGHAHKSASRHPEKARQRDHTVRRLQPGGAATGYPGLEEDVDPEWAEYVADVLAKRCEGCGFANGPDDKVCSACGLPLEITCPKCGTLNPGDAESCFECDHIFSPELAQQIEQMRVRVAAAQRLEAGPDDGRDTRAVAVYLVLAAVSVIMVALFALAWLEGSLSPPDEMMAAGLGMAVLTVAVVIFYIKNKPSL